MMCRPTWLHRFIAQHPLTGMFWISYQEELSLQFCDLKLAIEKKSVSYGANRNFLYETIIFFPIQKIVRWYTYSLTKMLTNNQHNIGTYNIPHSCIYIKS